MRKIKTVVTLFALSSLVLWGACNQSGVTMDPAQVKAQVDALVQNQSAAIRDSANAACQQRLMNELPAKADSVAQAKQAENK